MTDEELMIINCVMYDPTLSRHDGQTLEQWANSVDPAEFTIPGDGGDRGLTDCLDS